MNATLDFPPARVHELTKIKTEAVLGEADIELLDKLVIAMNADPAHSQGWHWTRERVLAAGAYLHLFDFAKTYNIK